MKGKLCVYRREWGWRCICVRSSVCTLCICHYINIQKQWFQFNTKKNPPSHRPFSVFIGHQKCISIYIIWISLLYVYIPNQFLGSFCVPSIKMCEITIYIYIDRELVIQSSILIAFGAHTPHAENGQCAQAEFTPHENEILIIFCIDILCSLQRKWLRNRYTLEVCRRGWGFRFPVKIFA